MYDSSPWAANLQIHIVQLARVDKEVIALFVWKVYCLSFLELSSVSVEVHCGRCLTS